MTPDKIYTDNRSVYAELPIFSQSNANIEYIRKEALLEWAKMKKGDIKKVDWDGDYYFGLDFMLDELIDKLNEI